MTEQSKMPELPEPDVSLGDGFGAAYSDDAVLSIQAEAWNAAIAHCISTTEALRDDHCKATQQDPNPYDHCHADGRDGCEFVAAWNDAIERLRTLRKETENHG